MTPNIRLWTGLIKNTRVFIWIQTVQKVVSRKVKAFFQTKKQQYILYMLKVEIFSIIFQINKLI